MLSHLLKLSLSRADFVGYQKGSSTACPMSMKGLHICLAVASMKDGLCVQRNGNVTAAVPATVLHLFGEL